MKTQGGHAIMLRVELNDDIRHVEKQWLARYPKCKSKIDRPHMTILFIGRNMDEKHGELIKMAALQNLSLLPKTVKFNGRFSLFGAKRDHLVTMFEFSDELQELRSALISDLRELGVPKPPDGFGFTPHVTIAVGPPERYGPPKAKCRKEKLKILGFEVKLGGTITTVGGV